MPELSGSTTFSASKVANAASAALPPLRRISAPAAAARRSAALTIPGTVACAEADGLAQPAIMNSGANRENRRERIGCALLAPDRLGNVGKAFALQPLG